MYFWRIKSSLDFLNFFMFLNLFLLCMFIFSWKINKKSKKKIHMTFEILCFFLNIFFLLFLSLVYFLMDLQFDIKGHFLKIKIKTPWLNPSAVAWSLSAYLAGAPSPFNHYIYCLLSLFPLHWGLWPRLCSRLTGFPYTSFT